MKLRVASQQPVEGMHCPHFFLGEQLLPLPLASDVTARIKSPEKWNEMSGLVKLLNLPVR